MAEKLIVLKIRDTRIQGESHLGLSHHPELKAAFFRRQMTVRLAIDFFVRF